MLIKTTNMGKMFNQAGEARKAPFIVVTLVVIVHVVVPYVYENSIYS